MSILDAYRMFQEQQRAKGIDPSVAPRLTQQEQDAMRLAATSLEPTTASQSPSRDVSSTGMLTETREQSQARESVTDDTMSYEQRVNNLRNEFKAQYNVLEAKGFDYVNPSDLDYIIEEQAKEFAKAGVDSIYDLGKRSVDTTKQNVEVERIADPNTGNFKYYYSEEPTTAMGVGKRIEVQPSTVKEVDTGRSLGQGATEKMYIATLPSSMDELFNKKTGETVDVFAGGGTLRSGGEESTSFGNLYTGVEGGADLNVKFVGDQPIFYPLYQDTSDKNLVTFATIATTLAGTAYANKIGTAILGETAAGTVKATALGNAVVAGSTSLGLGRDLEDTLLAATMAYGVTYGVDALQSGKFGDYLVDNNILEADTVESLNIPRGVVEDTTALSGIGEGGAPGDVSLDTAEGLDYSLTEGTTIPSDALEKGIPIDGRFTDAQLNASLAESQFRSEFPKLVGKSDISFADPSFADILSGQGGVDLASDLPLLTSGGFAEELTLAGGLQIVDAASATTAVDDIIKAAGAGVVTKEAVGKVVEEASKFIDLKEVFGEDVGGFLEGAVGTGIDFAKLEEIRKRLEGRGEDIAGEFADLFKPYTVRSGLGVSEITPEGATATADVAYQPLRESFLSGATQLAGQIPGTREEAAQSLFADISRLSEPQRAREQERLLGTLAQKGLLGYGQTMPTVGGERRVNPLAESLFAAQEAGRAKESLAATQFGTTEADRLAQLSGRLTGAAQSIDKLPADQLARAQNIAYTLGQVPAREGLRTKAGFEKLGAQAEIAGLTELGDFGKGLFGLETDPGNVPIGGDKKYSAEEVRKILETVGITG